MARFAYERKKGKSGWVKLLMPNRSRELSVGMTDSLDCCEILNLGLEFSNLRENPKPVHGWLEFHEDAIQEHHLTIEHDDNPIRHSNILGWPPATHDQLVICGVLYDACRRRARFNPPKSEVSISESLCDHVEDL